MNRRFSILIPATIFLVFLAMLFLLLIFFRLEERSWILLISGIGIVVVLLGMLYFIYRIYFPIQYLQQKLKALSESRLLSDPMPGAALEFREVEDALVKHTQRLQQLSDMTNELARGKVVSDFKALNEEDELGKALLAVNRSIQLSREDDLKRRTQDEQQKWASKGLAVFGDFLRDSEQGIKENAGKLMADLVKYLEMEVGGMFIRMETEDGPAYHLAGAYAFDREKKMQKVFLPGEGLVGRCAMEKERILITDLPRDYIRIRSGMGEDVPASLVLVPMLSDTEVLGVLELASFNEIASYKIDFLEALGRSIAASLARSGYQD